MAKKVKLVELAENDKAKLRNTALCALSLTAIVCLILVSCFACAQQTPTVSPSQAQEAERQRLYWMGILCDTNWEPQWTAQDDGILEGFKMRLDANITFDTNAKGLLIRFGTPSLKQGSIVLESCEGKILFEDDKTWSVRFSEKNDEKYMTIEDSQGKTVYYTCL